MSNAASVTPHRDRTRNIATAALIAALLAASAYLTIPVQPVPITLQVFFVVLAALLLSPLWAFAATAVYVALGAAGVPVFAQGTAGLGVLAGPTGGYLIGFVLGATAGSASRRLFARTNQPSVIADVAATLVTIIVTYVVGTIQLAVVTKMGAVAAIIAGVAPFIAIDIAKGAAAAIVASAVRRATSR